MFAPRPAEVRGFVTVKTAASLLILALMLGCRANVRGSATVDGDASGNLSADASGEGDGSDMSPASDDLAPAAASDRALLGARHDLGLVAENATAKCQCLAVALGAPSSSAFRWSAGAPSIDPETQLVIAQSSADQGCDEPKGSLGASYWGYRISGNDVVVLVESARGGRPLTSGAVIPRPVGPGQVYVTPASRRLPYGRPLDGKGLCKIGNPGQGRTTPFTDFELGQDAPTTTAPSGVGTVERNDPNDVPTTIEMPAN
jgi:hypothetical protein